MRFCSRLKMVKNLKTFIYFFLKTLGHDTLCSAMKKSSQLFFSCFFNFQLQRSHSLTHSLFLKKLSVNHQHDYFFSFYFHFCFCFVCRCCTARTKQTVRQKNQQTNCTFLLLLYNWNDDHDLCMSIFTSLFFWSSFLLLSIDNSHFSLTHSHIPSTHFNSQLKYDIYWQRNLLMLILFFKFLKENLFFFLLTLSLTPSNKNT